MPQIAVTGDRTSTRSAQDKLGAAFDRAMPLVPSDVREMLVQMRQPASLAIMGVTLVAWVASHACGVGEFIDAILLVIGALTIGFSAFEAAHELYDFARCAIGARTSHDLDAAAQHLARAIALIGITIVQAVLMRGQAKVAIARGRPQFLPPVGKAPPMPPAGNQLRVARPWFLGEKVLGDTDRYGSIRVARAGPREVDPETGRLGARSARPVTQQRAALYHELVHRYFSPRTGPLRHLRAQASITGYQRSALLRYLEEALAQGYGQLKENGFVSAKNAYRFPLDGGYVTVARMWHEGTVIGSVMLRGDLFHVSIAMGMPKPHEDGGHG